MSFDVQVQPVLTVARTSSVVTKLVTLGPAPPTSVIVLSGAHELSLTRTVSMPSGGGGGGGPSSVKIKKVDGTWADVSGITVL
jgi:hypothetical protein